MPNLIESLQGRDLGFLQIMANLWGIELTEQAVQPAIKMIASAVLDSTKVSKMVASLPGDAQVAIEELKTQDGRIPWAQFLRIYGEVREMGAAKRDRERPHEHPASVAEALWFRGLVSNVFLDTPSGPEEFAYIPNDLLELIGGPERHGKRLMGRQASTTEYAVTALVDDRILDHACSLLAAQRVGIDLPEAFAGSLGETITVTFLKSLLAATGILDNAGVPQPEPARQHLEAKRGVALLQLFRAWRQSKSINDLAFLPGLSLEGNWKNDPLESRQKVMGYLADIPAKTWWSMESFISAVKQHHPDFQRPAGDYDSWFIRSTVSSEFLRGFEHWDEVDGRLLAYLLTGPLHWLGVLDLAWPAQGQGVAAFRLSRWSKALLSDIPPTGLPAEAEPLVVNSDARVGARRMVPRGARYQLARFCELEKETPDGYLYRISPVSLLRARQQGLMVSQLVTLLNRNAKAVAPSLIKALERWDKQGVEARLEQMVVLRVVSDEVIQALRKSRASRFLGETLGPTSIAIKPGAVDKVRGVLAELGYLGEIRIDRD
jgi:hypothetical protein